MTKCVIFDLDGTLVDSAAICADIITQMLNKRGSKRTISCDDVHPYISVGGKKMVAALLGEYQNDPDRDINEFRAIYDQQPIPQDSIFNGVKNGLMTLQKAGFRMAICSNKPQNLCEKVLKELALAEMFEVIVGHTPNYHQKPEPDLMNLVLKRLQLNAQSCILVGDSEVDHQLAIACQMEFKHMTFGYADQAWDFGTVDQFDTFGDLVDDICSTASNHLHHPLKWNQRVSAAR